MLPDRIRFKLHFGPYRAPRLKPGAIVEDAIRGKVRYDRMTFGRIPWLLGGNEWRIGYIVCGDLVRALQHETPQAVAYWFGMSKWWVGNARKALGFTELPEGTRRLQVAIAKTPEGYAKVLKAAAATKRPDVRAKMSATRKGRVFSELHRQRLSESLKGRSAPKSAAHRKALSESAKRRGVIVPGVKVWTDEENDAVRRLSIADAARVTGRTVKAVENRRRVLGVAKRRRRKKRNRIG